MRIRWTSLTLALGVIALTVPAFASPHHKKAAPKHKAVHTAKAPSGAETSLVGISLFDKGIQVIALYGTPDIISPANVAMTGAAGGAGGPGGPGGGQGIRGPGGAGMPRAGMGGGKGGNGGASAGVDDPNDVGPEVLQQGGPPGMRGGGGYGGPPGAMGPGGGGMRGGPGGGYPGGGQGQGPRGMGAPGSGVPGAGAGGFGGPNSGGGTADNVVYTRWTYFRGASRYAFVFDKFNRVVQIEAIGIENAKVHTKRGIGFGKDFASLIKTYGPPDGYDIAGDNSLTVRYLLNAKVAFRLSRLGQKKPPVVTGIVVAAAKG